VANRVADSQGAPARPAAGPAGVTTQDTSNPTGQANVANNDDSLLAQCPIDTEVPPCDPICIAPETTEAPTGFDDGTNDLVKQGQHDIDRLAFEKRDFKEDGLGPVYNAQACSECHQNPVSGSVSQINELRAGHLINMGCRLPCGPVFVDAPGGSLINDRAIDPKIQERVPPLFSAGISREEEVRTTRTSLNTMGDGFVEAVPNETLLAIAADQPNDDASGHLVHGQAIRVPVVELPPDSSRRCRIGRFGHKDQHASLLSFSADAYLNEMGITNRFFLMENTSLGRDVSAFDMVADNQPCHSDPSVNCGEDGEEDINAFTQFMRATKAPARDKEVADTDAAQKGDQLFHKIGCAVCHQDTLVTAQEGVVINNGTFKVPPELANKIIHPFGDFLLHDIGTGDGIVQNGGATTRLKVRTAPLWGVRVHTRLMHDGLSLTFLDAILRHAGEAEIVRQNFESLSQEEQNDIITFLESL
ncbi:MAG TPA: di-heme oxidoredictase family protein, partial [Pyrinomonadaceae bacterium]|nr:di-heme oxidoredictase family protein [Pyrinomonadaceae bacterium]